METPARRAAARHSTAAALLSLLVACDVARSPSPGPTPPPAPGAASAGEGAPEPLPVGPVQEAVDVDEDMDAPVSVDAETAPAPSPPEPPPAVDLRPALVAAGLVPRGQGARGTCSVFTTCSAIEAALAARGRPRRLSPEFLNWAASQVAGGPSDGAFFHNALAGFERFGLCDEEALPYRDAYDAALAPPPEALEQAAALREECRDALVVHWIVPWQPNRFGVSEEQLAAIKAALAQGFPVAAGSGHSRLLVGYRDDPASPGGGVFTTQDSALARFDEVTYEFVRDQVADVFWIEAPRGPL